MATTKKPARRKARPVTAKSAAAPAAAVSVGPPSARQQALLADILANLVHLDLSSNEMLRDEGLRALAASQSLGALRSLVLSYVGLYEEAADIVLGSPLFAQLEHLDLSQGLSLADRDRLRAVFGDRLKC